MPLRLAVHAFSRLKSLPLSIPPPLFNYHLRSRVFSSTAAMPRPTRKNPSAPVDEAKPAANGKRKADSSKEFADKPAPSPTRKRQRVEEAGGVPPEEKYRIVDRRFYPKQMNDERCHKYTNGEIPRPIDLLEEALKESADERDAIEVKGAVVHYFKMDLRMKDNRGLHMASEKAKSKGVPLICVYLVSPEDIEAHLIAPARLDFMLRNVQSLKDELAGLNIPLYVELVPERKSVPGRLLDLCEKWGAAHLFANMEYEVDELRREIKLVKQGVKRGIAVNVLHDTCVVAPGSLETGAGKQFSVYSPWYRAWMKHLHANPGKLKLYPSPGKNAASVKETYGGLFASTIPDPSEEETLKSKRLTDEEKERFANIYPPGEQAAAERLEKFISQRITKYAEMRNSPAANATAMLSCHFASGTLSARTAVKAALDANSSKKLDSGNAGITGWISEVAWRDFYKHVLAHWPYVCMNKSFKPEYTDIEWDYDQETLDAWTEGRTGFPIVDAGMRQIKHIAYCHNRVRMIAASFLCKDLLQDWRMGERYFMLNLIDGDFASNNGGWGFSASTGVDPQPYFRIFNPLLQSEKFDNDGDYIRKWVPELKDVQGKAVHDPYGRGAEKIAEKNGYPRPMVVHKDQREKALAMYKSGLGRDTA